VVLRSGRPLEDRLASERLTVEELKEEARIHGHRDLSQLEWVILETDGQFSFIPKSG
jgi:uncharacterized membrane protein YcaP (DUF421 family)